MAAVLLASCTVLAQRSRFTSPEAHSSVTIAGKQITVDYYAPSMHGRKVMGGLVPYGQVWCTGANIATGITFPADVQIGNLRLPKGSYSIWTLPGERNWTLIVNRETGQFHLDYNSSLDFGRTPMRVKTLAQPVETFRIDLRDDGGNNGTLALVWERTEASIPFTLLP
ncbi:MAG: DUF2911 domain-containing protein [Acidobacteriota bacterium]|nr:DUF2911 domain-containing protein [Acidobacteriota bacterium]